jgi:hypothetical protein
MYRRRAMSDQTFNQQQIDTRIQALLVQGPGLKSKSRDQIVELGAQATPHLVEILQDKALWDDQAAGQGYAPIHAAEFLGEIGDEDALDSLYDVLVQVDPDALLDDAITDAIRDFGHQAVSVGLDKLDAWDDPFVEVLAYVFAGLPAHHAPLDENKFRSDKIFQVLLKFFVQNAVPGAGFLAEYGDPTAIDALEVALERYIAAAGGDTKYRRPIFRIADAIEELGGELTVGQRRHVSTLKARRSRSEEVVDQLANKDAPDNSATYQKTRDLGRNDPCWCGSGTKYKRCHWLQDNQ